MVLDAAESADGDFNQLCVRHADHRRVVPHRRKVRALGRVLHALLLLDRQACKTDHMVARQREIDGFAKSDASGRRRLGLLREQRARTGGKQQREYRASDRHDWPPVRTWRRLTSSAARSLKFNGNRRSVATRISITTDIHAMR